MMNNRGPEKDQTAFFPPSKHTPGLLPFFSSHSSDFPKLFFFRKGSRLLLMEPPKESLCLRCAVQQNSRPKIYWVSEDVKTPNPPHSFFIVAFLIHPFHIWHNEILQLILVPQRNEFHNSSWQRSQAFKCYNLYPGYPPFFKWLQGDTFFIVRLWCNFGCHGLWPNPKFAFLMQSVLSLSSCFLP